MLGVLFSRSPFIFLALLSVCRSHMLSTDSSTCWIIIMTPPVFIIFQCIFDCFFFIVIIIIISLWIVWPPLLSVQHLTLFKSSAYGIISQSNEINLWIVYTRWYLKPKESCSWYALYNMCPLTDHWNQTIYFFRSYLLRFEIFSMVLLVLCVIIKFLNRNVFRSLSVGFFVVQYIYIKIPY